MIKLLAFDGSGRKDSYNRKLLRYAESIATNHGAAVTMINLADYALPIYNQDIEAEHGLPKAVLDLKALFDQHHGFLIATPEFNGGVSALLKNAIDWLSRSAPNEKSLQQFRGKTAGLMSASPGRLGGMRGLIQLQTLLFGIGVTTVSDMVSVPFYGQAFDDKGNLTDETAQKAVASTLSAVTRIAKALQ